MGKSTAQLDINGDRYEVPALDRGRQPGWVRVAGDVVYNALGASRETTVVKVNSETEEHEIVPFDGVVDVGPADRFVIVEQHKNAGRNQRRLNTELSLLQQSYGWNNVFWPKNQEYVFIREFKLPKAKQYNTPYTPLAILIPKNYGHGVPIEDCFVTPGLRIWRKGGWRNIPNYHEAGYVPTGGTEWKQKGWTYLCLHAREWPPDAWFETYLKMLRTFLTDPFHPMYHR